MKINQSDLGKIYTNYLKDRIAVSSELCPSNENLFLWLRSKLPKREKNKITDHLVKCYDCAQEVQWLMDRIRKENGIVYEIKNYIDANYAEQPRKTRVPARRLSWKIISFAFALVLLAAVSTFSVFNFSSRSGLRGGATSPIILVSPVDKSCDANELKFVWKGLPNVKYYFVEVFDTSLAHLWRSDAVSLREVIPSKDLLQKLIPKETYFWMVTGVLTSETKAKSKLKEFKIRACPKAT
jgi:hypothetical protein